jgi:hypothetical protein
MSPFTHLGDHRLIGPDYIGVVHRRYQVLPVRTTAVRRTEELLTNLGVSIRTAGRLMIHDRVEATHPGWRYRSFDPSSRNGL